MAKRIVAKIYNKDKSTFLLALEVINDFIFEKNINGGLGSASILFASKIDEIDTNIIAINNYVEIYEQGRSSPDGLLIYSGYIDTIGTDISGSTESVMVDLVGVMTRLSLGLYRDGTAIDITQNSMQSSDIIKDIIDKYRANESSPFLNYTSDTIPDSGDLISYTFGVKTYAESIIAAKDRAGELFYWFIGADNLVHYEPIPSEATHTFTFGKNISSFASSESITDVVNNVLIWNQKQEYEPDVISERYYNTDSQTDYFPRWSTVADGRLSNEDTADNLGEAIIGAQKDPNKTISFTVIDSELTPSQGYNTSSVQPGDTCKIANISPDSVLSDNMLITRVVQRPTQIDLEVADLRSLTARELNDIRRSLNNQVYSDTIDSYTETSV